MESNPLPDPARVASSLLFYQRAAHKFAGILPPRERMAMAAMGLAGEAGEVVDELKKVLFHQKPLDLPKLVSELGDVLWYLAEVATVLDIELPQVAANNLDKLHKRHGGDSFKPHAEQDRGTEFARGLAEKFPPSCDLPKPGTVPLDVVPPVAADVVVHSARSPLTPREQAQAESRTHRTPMPPMQYVVHGQCILSSPEATASDRQRCRDEMQQLVDAHKMLDRLGAPGAPGTGSVRERLFYLIDRRGWKPNVRAPWGDDVVPDTLAHVEVKGPPTIATIVGYPLAAVVNFLHHVRPFFAEACATSREHTPGERHAKSTVTCTVPVFVWDAFVNAADELFPRAGFAGPDEEPQRPGER